MSANHPPPHPLPTPRPSDLSGVAVNPTAGVLTWTPTETQGPSTNTITVKVTDNGRPALSATIGGAEVCTEVKAVPALPFPHCKAITGQGALVVTDAGAATHR